MSTGANRFDLNFLWVTKKLISAVLIVLKNKRNIAFSHQRGCTEPLSEGHALHSLVSYSSSQWDTRDERDEFLVTRLPDSEVPIRHVFRRCEGPVNFHSTVESASTSQSRSPRPQTYQCKNSFE